MENWASKATISYDMDEEAKRTKDNKEDLIIESAADGAKKLKIFEYELCNLLISLNLPFKIWNIFQNLPKNIPAEDPSSKLASLIDINFQT